MYQIFNCKLSCFYFRRPWFMTHGNGCPTKPELQNHFPFHHHSCQPCRVSFFPVVLIMFHRRYMDHRASYYAVRTGRSCGKTSSSSMEDELQVSSQRCLASDCGLFTNQVCFGFNVHTAYDAATSISWNAYIRIRQKLSARRLSHDSRHASTAYAWCDTAARLL